MAMPCHALQSKDILCLITADGVQDLLVSAAGVNRRWYALATSDQVRQAVPSI